MDIFWINSREIERILIKSRGAKTRYRIIHHLVEKPMNQHELSRVLDVNYRTIRHHIGVLEEQGLVQANGEGYAKKFSLTNKMIFLLETY